MSAVVDGLDATVSLIEVSIKRKQTPPARVGGNRIVARAQSKCPDQQSVHSPTPRGQGKPSRIWGDGHLEHIQNSGSLTTFSILISIQIINPANLVSSAGPTRWHSTTTKRWTTNLKKWPQLSPSTQTTISTSRRGMTGSRLVNLLQTGSTVQTRRKSCFESSTGASYHVPGSCTSLGIWTGPTLGQF